jgi:hypothetical protein
MTAFTSLLTGLAVVVGILAIAIYFFGIPPELKRKMENTALKTMGENKASYMLKGAVFPLPTPSPSWRTDRLRLPQTNHRPTLQTRSPKCQKPTRKISRTSNRACPISPAALRATALARRRVSWAMA